MTWRVAILAFTIMLAGATAPVIRDAVGGRDGYRVMGVVMALLILVGVLMRLRAAPARAPIGAVEPGRRARCATSCGSSPGARDFRLLLTTFVRAGARRPAACSPASTTWPTDVLDRPGRRHRSCSSASSAPALLLTPVWARVGERDRQEAGLRRRLACVLAAGAAAGRRCAAAAPAAVVFVATGAGRRRVRRLPGLPDGDAARRGGGRRRAHRQQPGRRLHRRLDRRRDPRPGARARRCSPSCSRSAATARRPSGRRHPARLRAAPRSRWASRCCRPP